MGKGLETNAKIPGVKIRDSSDFHNNIFSGIRCVDHGFTYGGRCYALLGLDSDNYITYDEAVAECTRNESLMAEIHDRFQQNAFQDYIRAKMPAGNSVVGIWIGMAYDSSVIVQCIASTPRRVLSAW